ncbi:MAG TPA: dTDP-4-amino-4,6-dideoxygalactose transaminase [Gemmatimonadaceae bacterium]
MTPSLTRPTRIPFSRTAVMGRELEYVAEAARDQHLSGDGTFTKRCQDWLQHRLGAPAALMTSSCTHALELAALLLDIKPGDEVIVPTFTFVSTVNAFVLRGATPVFVDSRPDTLNMDERQLARLITPRTRAIVPVHYAGIACEMDAIANAVRGRNIAIIEDNAHGLCGTYNGRALGTLGALSTLSFHDTKNFSSGEGGALVINDAALVERAEIIREKGTNRSRFFRGQVDKYTWVDIGSSYLPSELQAAFLLGQLESEERIQARRRKIWQAYQQGLKAWSDTCGVGLPVVPPECASSWHLFHLMLPRLDQRQDLIRHLRAHDIGAVFHYLPLHLSDMGRRLAPNTPALPVAESAADRLLRLPMYNNMTDAEIEEVVACVTRWRPSLA